MPTLDLGDFHPALVHYPLSLVIIAFVFDLLYFIKKQENFRITGSWFMIAAAILAIPTALSGFAAKDFYPEGDPDVQRHQYMALTTVAYTIGYALFRAYALFEHKVFSVYLYLLLSLINVSLVSVTAEFGGIVVRGKGIMFDSLRPLGAPLPYDQVE